MLDAFLHIPQICWCCTSQVTPDLRARSQQLQRQRKKDVHSTQGEDTGRKKQPGLSQNKQNHLPEGLFVLIPCVSSDHTSQVCRRDNSLYSISKLLQSAAVISARERKSKCNLANYTLRRAEKTNKKSLWTCRCQHKCKRLIRLFSYCGTVPVSSGNGCDSSSSCLQEVSTQHRGHPQHSCEGRATGFQLSDLFCHSCICSEACAGSHMGRDNYISVNGCSISWGILYPKISKARSESLRLNTVSKIWRRLTPYGPITRIGKPPTYFILSFFSLEHSPARSTVQESAHTPLRTAGRSRADPKHQLWDLLLAGTALGVKQQRQREASSCCCWWNEVLLPTETPCVLLLKYNYYSTFSSALCLSQPRGCFLCCIWSSTATQSTGIAPARPQQTVQNRPELQNNHCIPHLGTKAKSGGKRCFKLFDK